jgi:hypothetical protein
MATEMRKTGIDVVGDMVAWGAHFVSSRTAAVGDGERGPRRDVSVHLADRWRESA